MSVSERDFYTCGSGVKLFRGEMRTNEPMGKHTSWRAGGHAERYFMPKDQSDLVQFLKNLPKDELVYMVGLGSNLLVRDGGLRGTVLGTHARLNDLQLVEQHASGGIIYASAGVACAKVARFASMHHLTGAEFLAGIPGTVGGALAMNAGCYGAETWEIVKCAKIINRRGEVRMRDPGDYQLSYRHVALSTFTGSADTEWFIGGFFRLRSGNQAVSRQKIKKMLAARIRSQPLNLPNAGSVFRNPPGAHAAKLIEACGLKGFHIGGAMVSPKHANFIVNTGHATATDIESLITMIYDTVKQKTGIGLVQEVRIIGDVRSFL